MRKYQKTCEENLTDTQMKFYKTTYLRKFLNYYHHEHNRHEYDYYCHYY